jgi:hypothetical protein
MQVCIDLSAKWRPHRDPGLPDAFCGALSFAHALLTVRLLLT